MAHLPPSTAIFSPSVARIAASTAKDWNYVDSWLSSKFHGRTPPPFERNPETLKVLLALAALNETADEERDLVARAEALALQELDASSHVALDTPDMSTTAGIKEGILTAVEGELTRDGRACLDSMAALAVQLGVAYPEPETLGRRMLSLQTKVHELEQMKGRVQILQRYIEDESATVDAFLQDLRGDGYKPSSDLAKQNLEIQRKIKAMGAKLPELQDRVAALASSLGTSQPTIEVTTQQEHEYLSLLSRKQELDAQVHQFAGLPDVPEMARAELEQRRSQLRNISHKRDAVFEGLVERESPKKGR